MRISVMLAAVVAIGVSACTSTPDPQPVYYAPAPTVYYAPAPAPVYSTGPSVVIYGGGHRHHRCHYRCW